MTGRRSRSAKLLEILVAVAALGLALASTAPAVSARAPSAARAHAPSRVVTKLLVVIEENHSLSQMRTGMPYAYSLTKRFGYAANYFALTHPSLPNYIGIVSGQTYGIHDDQPPSAHRLPGHTVFGEAVSRGKSAALYADGMQSACATDSSSPPPYAVGHNPWPYFVGERGSCRVHDRPVGSLWSAIQRGRLPNAGVVVPDKCHDAHDCGLSSADAWFRNLMAHVFRGPDWRSGHLAVVLTADEDDGSQSNQVLTVVIHPSQRHHVVTARLNHYSLTKLFEQVTHTPFLNNARTAPSLARAFGLPLR